MKVASGVELHGLIVKPTRRPAKALPTKISKAMMTLITLIFFFFFGGFDTSHMHNLVCISMNNAVFQPLHVLPGETVW